MIGEILERGQSSVKKAGKQTVSDFVQTTKGQITGLSSGSDQGTNEQANSVQTAQQQMTDKDRVEFLRNLYGKSDNSSKTKSQGSNPPQKSPNVGKTPEELAKIEALRKQLHGDYYQSLTNPAKPQEETVTEKLEREDEKEKMELWEKDKKKPPPLPATVKQGTGESVVGVSG